MKGLLGMGAAAAVALLACACGEKPVQPKPLPTPPSIAEFTADHTRVSPGEAVTLSFKADHADEAIVLDQSGNPVDLTGSASEGSAVVHPSQTSFYVLTVTGAGGKASAFVQVAVNEELRDAVLLAVPPTITSGEEAQLIWSAFHATSAAIHASNGEDYPLDVAKGSGVLVVKPARSISYLLTSNGLDGSKPIQRTADLKVEPVLQSFTANPPAALPGVPITLSWTTRGASEVTVSEASFGELATYRIPEAETKVDHGSFEWPVPHELNGEPIEEGHPLRFTLTVKQQNPEITLTRTLDSFVGEGPKLVSFAAPDAITAGDSFTLGWRTLNASRIQVYAEGGLIYEPFPSDQGSVANGHLTLEAPQQDTTFRIVAFGQQGTKIESSKQVRVVPLPQITDFTLPATIGSAGDPAAASWRTTDATQVVLRVKNGPSLFTTSSPAEIAAGTATVLPGVRTTFVLEAYNDAGRAATMEKTVEVTSPDTFSASPGTVNVGEPITVGWSFASSGTEIIGDPNQQPARSNPGTSWVELDGDANAQMLPFGDSDNATSEIPVPKGFTFPYFGFEASRFFVSTNGFVSFADVGSRPGNEVLDDFGKAVPKMVAPFWDDLVLGNHGRVLSLIDGQTFPRRLIVQWDKVQTASDPASELTFQVQLFETGQVRFGYKTLNGADSAGQGASIGFRANGAVASDLAIAGSASVTAGDELTFFGNAQSSGEYTVTAESPGTFVMFSRTANGDYIVYPAPSTVFHPDSVIINELLLRPASTATQGQWIELYNTTDQELDLSGMRLTSLATFTEFDLPQGTTIAAHGYLVLGESDDPLLNGGANVDVVWNGLVLDPSLTDTLSLVTTEPINVVQYYAAELSDEVALQSPDLATVGPDGKPVRCQAVEPFGTTGELGTPGAANSPCFEYGLQQIPPAFEDISTTGRRLFFGNFDEEFEQVTLTDPIQYFGSDFTSIGISANGLVSFTQLTIAGLTNRTIPGSGLPESTVAPFWDDLNANTTFSDSSVFVEQLPATPNSPAHTIVQWNRLGDLNHPDQLTFEVKFFESGVIEFHYADMISTTSTNDANGNSATIWIERPDGTAALPVSINKAGSWDHTAFRFTPKL